MAIDYKIVESNSPSGLTKAVGLLMNESWEPVGSHCVTVVHKQHRYAGKQHMDTVVESCYTQTMIKTTF